MRGYEIQPSEWAAAFINLASLVFYLVVHVLSYHTRNLGGRTWATIVNAHPEVAHNYERTHRLNMWFVLATETPEGITAAADAIEEETGIKVLRFPKLQEFYIGFRVAA